MDAPAARLDTIGIVRKISLPDLPTGSLSGKVLESLEEPYEAKLELTIPRETGQSFSTDFEILTRNAETGDVNFSYSKIYAGGYTFTLRDSFGCLKTYDLTIDFNPDLFIPNIFTPDGDGVNEEFYIRNLPANSGLEITDRWGQNIFSSNSYANDWSAEGMPDGVYYYKLSIGNKKYTGWIEVLTGK
jgi:gliding motility-associated-like protein